MFATTVAALCLRGHGGGQPTFINVQARQSAEFVLESGERHSRPFGDAVGLAGNHSSEEAKHNEIKDDCITATTSDDPL